MKQSLIFFICFLFAYSCSSGKQKIYIEKMSYIQSMIGGERYNTLIESFMDIQKRYPDSLSEVYFAYKRDYPEDINQIELCFFIDAFAHNKGWVGYFPIYDNTDAQIISYVILSAGIDGKLNNIVAPSEKLHLDDWKQKLKLYNPNEFDGFNIYVDDKSKHKICRKGYIEQYPYNAKEEKSGDKDLLIYVYHLYNFCDDITQPIKNLK
jgi:hypothetical protein